MYKTKENKKGISLIVIVITIIVVVIVAVAVILTLTNNNPIAEARKATFLNDISTFQDDLNMYKTNEYAKRMGEYDSSLLNATSSGLTYNGTSVSGQDNIYDVIPSLEGKTKYLNEFEVESGGIKYVGTNTEKADWAQNEAGIPADVAKPSIEVTTANTLPIKAGTNVSYTFNMAASTTITETNLTGKIKIINELGTELVTQPTINIGSVTGTTTEKTVTITVNTTGMAEGTYKIKVLAGAVKTSTQESLEFVISTSFEIDNTAPNMPTITLNPTTATNGNVTATLTKANSSDTLEYSTNGTTWNAYTTALTITSNLTVYARETDSANNISSQATQIISNIDKTVPQNATMSLTTTGDKINGTITIADSVSGINVSQSKYIIATQSTAYGIADVAWNSATVMGVTSKTISETKADGTYYVQVLSVDNAGNKLVNVSSAIVVLVSGALGTITNPYLIGSASELNNIRNNLNAYYKLTNNIDLSSYSNWSPIGDTYMNTFNGSLDGNGYTISNLKINNTVSHSGLFGYVGSSSTIKNLKMTGAVINSTGANTGIIAGNNLGIIQSVSVSGNISNAVGEIGGIAGCNYNEITKSSANVTINLTGNRYDVGGISGINNSGSVTECYSQGSITGWDQTGGITGYNIGDGSEVVNCYSTANVTGHDYVGGIIGWNGSGMLSKVKNTYSISYVKGNTYIGGIAGRTNNATGESNLVLQNYALNSCLEATGGVKRVCGTTNNGINSMINNYASNSISVVGTYLSVVDGLNELDGLGGPLSNYQNQSIYANNGWDFTNVWIMKSGFLYPQLRWQ